MDDLGGVSEMDAMIAKLRALSGMVERSAPAIADALGDEIRRGIAAGTKPDGTPWVPTQDGHLPLQGAAAALTTVAIGTVVIARLDGHHARHHLGAVRGSSKDRWLARQILPSTKTPKPVTTAIHATLGLEFARTVKK